MDFLTLEQSVWLSGYLVRECRIDKVDNAKEKYQP